MVKLWSSYGQAMVKLWSSFLSSINLLMAIFRQSFISKQTSIFCLQHPWQLLGHVIRSDQSRKHLTGVGEGGGRKDGNSEEGNQTK